MSIETCLIATVSLVFTSLHLQTDPQAPLPIIQRYVQFCICDSKIMASGSLQLQLQARDGPPYKNDIFEGIFLRLESNLEMVWHDAYLDVCQCISNVDYRIQILNITLQQMNTSNLFRAIPSATLPLTFISRSLGKPESTKEEWNIRDLQAKMRKGVKKEVEVASMGEELKVFYQMQREIAITKVITLIAFTFGLFVLCGIQGAVIFTFLLLIATEIFCSLTLTFSDPKMIANVRKIQPIIYCSIFYSLLKWAAGIDHQQIDWTFTALALIFTSARVALIFYHPFLLLSSRKVISKAVRQQSFFGNLFIFPEYVIERVKMVSEISKYLVLMICVSLSIVSLILLYFDRFTLDIFMPRNIIISFLIFAGLQLYLDFLDFINLTFTQNKSLSKVIKDKIPIFLNLLRLESKPLNRLIQLQSLKCVYLKVSSQSTRNFLQTETCKSLIYHTYMDIFNQFASQELQKTHAVLREFLATAKVNDRVLALKKGLLEDLLIYFRKAAAFLHSEWQSSAMLKELATTTFMFATIQQIRQSQDKTVEISQRVSTLALGLIQRITECSTRASLSSYTRVQLGRLSVSLQSQLHHQ